MLNQTALVTIYFHFMERKNTKTFLKISSSLYQCRKKVIKYILREFSVIDYLNTNFV